ncbi:MAG: adenosylcobinamide-phosphate synthase CbiB [Acidimicrobiales bacterium]
MVSRAVVVGRGRSVAAGIVADLLLGEPPDAIHPVVWFGRAMRAVEARAYGDDRWRGGLHAAAGVALGAGAGGVVRSTGVATWVAVAGRQLRRVATTVGAALEGGDLEEARRLLPALAGRDPEGLDEKDVARAVVESVAENTVDAIVAPALWALVAGAPGALGYRAVNTIDAMVGHRSVRYERYGWSSARLDDLAAWLPARATAVLVAAVRPASAVDVWTAVRTQAPAHPSPNAGVAEAAFAAALGLRLGGETRYPGRVEARPFLGTGRPPEAGDIASAVRLSAHVGAALAAGLTLGGARARAGARR